MAIWLRRGLLIRFPAVELDFNGWEPLLPLAPLFEEFPMGLELCPELEFPRPLVRLELLFPLLPGLIPKSPMAKSSARGPSLRRTSLRLLQGKGPFALARTTYTAPAAAMITVEAGIAGAVARSRLPAMM